MAQHQNIACWCLNIDVSTHNAISEHYMSMSQHIKTKIWNLSTKMLLHTDCMLHTDKSKKSLTDMATNG